MKTLVLIDGDDVGDTAPIHEDRVLINWGPARGRDKARSLVSMAESSSEQLRAEYVDWCTSIANGDGTAGLDVRMRSALLNGGSFWWAGVIAARSPLSSAAISEIFRLRMLEQCYLAEGFQHLRYVGADERLKNVLAHWCRTLGHEFSWLRTAQPAVPRSRRTWRSRVPHPVQALLHVASFLRRRYLVGVFSGDVPEPLPAAELAIVTYFPNLEPGTAKEGRYRSRYWGSMHDLIGSIGMKVNWIWFHHDSSEMTFGDAVDFSRTLNRRSDETGQRYLLLEDRLTPGGLAWAISEYLRLLAASFSFRRLRSRFTLKSGGVNFFELLREEWFSSIRGSAAMSACLYAAAFRNTVDQLPRTTTRLAYPWENQGWEHLLLCAWRRVRRGPALAVAHTPTCTSAMDLRTFRGPESAGKPQDRQLPDTLVAFGLPAAETLVDWGWPADIVSVAEALRYQQLTGKYNSEWRELPLGRRRLLVVTGMQLSETQFQLELLSAASLAGALSHYSAVTIKPHPFGDVKDLLSSLRFSLLVKADYRPLQELFTESDVVFASNSTSAGLEAAWFGLPIILTAPIDGVNLSPLKSMPGTSFVGTVETLAEELKQPRRIHVERDTFLLDPDLPRWRALLTGPPAAFRESRLSTSIRQGIA